MKRILAVLFAFALVLVSCGEAGASPVGRYFLDSRAAEDAYGVYYSVSEAYENDGFYYYNKQDGTTTRLGEPLAIAAAADGMLYFGTADISTAWLTSVSSAEFRAEPMQWRQNAVIWENESWSTALTVYGERIALMSNAATGDVSSVDLTFGEPTHFYDDNRILCGYEGGKYYYLNVQPVGENSVQLTLCREDTPLFVLHERWEGEIAYNDYCAILDGYVYYYRENFICRRKLSRFSREEVLWDGFDRGDRSSPYTIFSEDGKITAIHSLLSLYRLSSMHFLAVTGDGVYVRDDENNFTRISLDGSEVVTLAQKFDLENNAYFISAIDGRFKYASARGVFIVE